MLQQPAGLPAVAEMFKRWLALAQSRQLSIFDLFNAAATLQSLGQTDSGRRPLQGMDRS